MTLQDLLNRFYWSIGDNPASPSLVAVDVATSLINEALRGLVESLNIIETNASSVPNVNGIVTLPADFSRMLKITYGVSPINTSGGTPDWFDLDVVPLEVALPELKPIDSIRQAMIGTKQTSQYLFLTINTIQLFDTPPFNLLTPNQSAMVDSIDPGYSGVLATISLCSSPAWIGTNSIGVASSGSAGSTAAGLQLYNGVVDSLRMPRFGVPPPIGSSGGFWPVTPGCFYTASVGIQGSAGGEQIGLAVYSSEGALLGGAGSPDYAYTTLSTYWQKLTTNVKIPAGVTGVYMDVVQPVGDTDPYIYWVDGIALVQGTVAAPLGPLTMAYLAYPAPLVNLTDVPTDVPVQYQPYLATVYARMEYAKQVGYMSQYAMLAETWESIKREVEGSVEARIGAAVFPTSWRW